MKKISILVPIYGVEKFIKQCAQSLFEQTYTNIEYVFVNDCTKDNSITILKDTLKHYPQRLDQVKIINHQTNEGLGGARATAIKNATGDYILHVDSDDYLATHAVELLINKAEMSGTDIVDGGYYDFCTNKSTMVSHNPYHIDSIKYIKLLVSRAGLMSNQIWGRLIRRELYLEKKAINIQGIDFAEDYSVLPILLDGTKREFVDECIYYYRNDNSSSYMHNLSQKNIISCIKAHEIVYNYFVNSKSYNKIEFFLNYGMLNLFCFCKKNEYDYLHSELYHPLKLNDFLLKLYFLSLQKSKGIFISNLLRYGLKKIYVEPLLK